MEGFTFGRRLAFHITSIVRVRIRKVLSLAFNIPSIVFKPAPKCSPSDESSDMTPNNVSGYGRLSRSLNKGRLLMANAECEVRDAETCPLLEKETIITIDYVGGVSSVVPTAVDFFVRFNHYCL